MVDKMDDVVIVPSIFVKLGTGSFYDDYTIGILVSKQGGFGEVYQCEEKQLKDTNQKRAVKIIKKRNTQNELITPEQFKNEVNLLKHLDHPNIVQVYDFYED
jgi:serine/threonine protein kinase